MSGTSTITLQQFRDTMPAFQDQSKYPDPMVQMWLNVASQLSSATWGQFWQPGVMMLTAHNLLMDIAANGPGGGVGMMISKSLGPGSVGYDVTTASEKDAGQYNATTYGRRYISMARMVGMGGAQISAAAPDPNMPGFGNAWLGPGTGR